MNSEMKEAKEERLALSIEHETSIWELSQLLNSLISSSYSVRRFPGKWQLIRDKLEQLTSGLCATADVNNFGDNPALSLSLQSLVSTLNNIQVLIDRCSDESCSVGKLLLRSDLDLISSKLDVHIKHLTEICGSGVLIHSQAIVPVRPTAGATLDDMRFYLKDLFLRLRVGDSDIKAQTLVTLHEVLCEDEKYIKIVVLEKADFVSLLINFLEFGDLIIQEEAAGAISLVAEFRSYRGVLVTGGVIAPLLRVLEVGSKVGKGKAAQALSNLTENSDNAWSISAHGGVTVLLKICSNVGSSSDLISSACGVLRNLSRVEEIKRFMIEEGIVSILVKLLGLKEEECQTRAIRFLYEMALEDVSFKQIVINAGVLESLVHLLDPDSPYSLKSREVALSAIEFFYFSSTTSMNILMATAFLDWVLFFLRNGEISIQESAVKAVTHLCKISEEYKKSMGKAGFMPELVRSLEAKSSLVRETAAEALCSLISIQSNRKAFIQDDHNVNQVMRLLDPNEEKSATTKCFLSILMSLTDSNSGRRKIMASGYICRLEKLADSGIVDAKKIIKKLSGNRFRSILNGIWSL